MKNFKGFLCSSFCLFLLSSSQLYAQEKQVFSSKKSSKISKKSKIIKPQEKNELIAKEATENYKHSLTVSLDRLNGKADEIVYKGAKKISHLEWDIKNLKMLSLGFNSQISDIFEARIKFSNGINNGDGKMVDYDWYGSGVSNGANWTHRSISDVKIQKAQQFDIAGSFNIPASFNINQDEFRFNFGYKYDHFKWRDYGGSYIYSTLNQNYEPIAFRDLVGTFDFQRGITYQQTFKTPYIGFEYKKQLFDKKINANIFANYSNIVSAEDEDIHHQRNLKFNEYFTNGKYYNFGANILGKIQENLYLGAGYEFVYYPENRGYTIVKNLNTNSSTRYDDSAGIRNKFNKISVNLKYNFATNSNLFN